MSNVNERLAVSEFVHKLTTRIINDDDIVKSEKYDYIVMLDKVYQEYLNENEGDDIIEF